MTLNYNPGGWDAGGGAWGVQVWAFVQDVRGNPVEDGILVDFSVEPAAANISLANTGNQNRNGETNPGTAYTEMIYQSANTFDPIEILANIRTEQGQINESIDTILPLQEGDLVLRVAPANWQFNEEDTLASICIQAELQDGHRQPINNGWILFTTSRGQLFWFNEQDTAYVSFRPNPARRRTGVDDIENDEPPGVATVYLRVEENEIFFNPENNEETVTIQIRLEGYNDVVAEPVEILFTRQIEE